MLKQTLTPLREKSQGDFQGSEIGTLSVSSHYAISMHGGNVSKPQRFYRICVVGSYYASKRANRIHTVEYLRLQFVRKCHHTNEFYFVLTSEVYHKCIAMTHHTSLSQNTSIYMYFN